MSDRPLGVFFTPLNSPASVSELMVVLDAVAHGARMSRFRLLDVACINGHRLAQVLAMAAGPVLYARGFEDARGKRGALALGGLEPSARVCVMCQCGSANLPASFVIDRLAAGIRRAAYP